MARFIFKMQNILNLKYKLESQAKTAFGIAARKLAEEEERLAELHEKRDAYEKKARELVNGPLDFVEIKYSKQAMEMIEDAIRHQNMMVLLAQRNLESARAHLAEVMIERKTYEILRERAFEEFKREIEMEESKQIDQLVSYTYTSARQEAQE